MGLWEGQRALLHQLRVLGERCKLPQRGTGQSPGKFGFRSILGPQKSRQNDQLAFESGRGATTESERGHVPRAPLPQRRTAPACGIYSGQRQSASGKAARSESCVVE